MSHLLVQSPKHCAKHGMNVDKLYKRLFYAISTFLISILSILFLTWLILRPSKPHFFLQQTNVYQLNLSGPHLINSSIEATLLSKNPNKKVGVLYDQIQAYASYKGQQITLHSSIPPFYQPHEVTNTLSALLMGSWVPVAPSFGYEVDRDQVSGKLSLDLKLNGRLRWKVGSWVSGHYRFNVDCVAVMAFESNMGFGPMSSTEGTQCSTSV
ncbi:NDR1/HIN1-like protein 26 [Magnolia sinica]|uniref:NDR1/HIN1-like protein 26 n=1 Tax=Magnolia sinica TaxID=86752 RepID=UPI00265A343C|nr:NDR1/HIN1-like protein 26 [Magnolia sinica]